MHAGTRRMYCSRERRPVALPRVPVGMAVGTTTFPPGGTWPRKTGARGRRREVAEDVRGPTVGDDSQWGTLAAVLHRVPKPRWIQHVRRHASPGTLRNSDVPPVYPTVGLPSGASMACPRPLGWTQVVDRYGQLIHAHRRPYPRRYFAPSEKAALYRPPRTRVPRTP